jgi:hypothetical protein
LSCSEKAKKNRLFRGVQRYKCTTCHKQFQNERRLLDIRRSIWFDHIARYMTVATLAIQEK